MARDQTPAVLIRQAEFNERVHRFDAAVEELVAAAAAGDKAQEVEFKAVSQESFGCQDTFRRRK
jgi:cytochrome c556